MTKLWQKSTTIQDKVEQFTVGKDRELDLFLAEHDVIGSLAHAQMLDSIGLLEKNELKALQKELKLIHSDIKKGSFRIEEGVEDVHSQIELQLTQKLGDIGKKIHSGRSRNDQVLLDLKLFMRSEIEKTVVQVKKLFDRLINLSEHHKDKLLPGYTHMQVAMPSSFGLWFGAYAESLIDDLIMLNAAFKIVNKNPLGSAAGYGSSFPLNRQMTTDLLGFESMNHNVVYAQMGRGKAELNTSMALASIASTLNKLAMDVCIYMGQDHGFISFPDELTTGSSIMPHKKNPDVFELTRAKNNKLQALPNEITMIISNLPSGYHRDLQLIKENFIPAFEIINSCLEMTEFMLQSIIVKDDLLNQEKYKYIFSVEAVNKEVLKGVPFRDAYKKVGRSIEEGDFDTDVQINHTHEGSIGNLCNDRIRNKMDKTIQQFHFQEINQVIDHLLANIKD